MKIRVRLAIGFRSFIVKICACFRFLLFLWNIVSWTSNFLLNTVSHLFFVSNGKSLQRMRLLFVDLAIILFIQYSFLTIIYCFLALILAVSVSGAITEKFIEDDIIVILRNVLSQAIMFFQKTDQLLRRTIICQLLRYFILLLQKSFKNFLN